MTAAITQMASGNISLRDRGVFLWPDAFRQLPEVDVVVAVSRGDLWRAHRRTSATRAAQVQRHTVDAELQLSQREESVTVSADSTILQTESATLGHVVDSTQVTTLPLVTRNFTQLTALSPGATASLPDTLAVGNGSININVNAC